MHGAEAVVTNCTFLNVPCVSKRRFPKQYRTHVLDSKLRRERTKLEAKVMHRAKTTGTLCPFVLNVDLEKCEIIQTKLNGTALVDYLSTASRSPTSSAGSTRMLKKAGEQLGRLHNARISHGDSTTSNFMVVGKEVYLFDFGLSEFDSSIENQAIDLLLFSKSVSPAQFQTFLKGYKKICGKNDTKRLLVQVKEIQSRARYVER